MDCVKIGRLIARLRKEQGLTQQNIADALSVSNKTISKWECGLGCPDVSLWQELSGILGVETRSLMEGEIVENRPDSGNIDKIGFYVCPTCMGVLMATGSSSVFCCGRKLERLAPAREEGDAPRVTREESDAEYYVTIDHEMTRQHYILFAAYVKNDMVILNRMYPEQSAALRLPMTRGGRLYIYCVQHGLVVIKL